MYIYNGFVSYKMNVTIPHSNYSQSVEDGWFVFSYVYVPTRNARSLTLFGEGEGGGVMRLQN